jgi:fibronectin-binding autotransporter adhesin
MKNLTPNSLRYIPAALGLLLSILVNHAGGATVISWDPYGTASVGGNGTWDTTTTQWSADANQAQAELDSLVVWKPADIACFCAGPVSSSSQGTFTITVNSAITLAGLDNGNDHPGSCNLTLSGTGSLNLASGTVVFNTGGTTLGSTTINIPITGSGALESQCGGLLTLNGVNIYGGATTINNNGAASKLTIGGSGSLGSGTYAGNIANGGTFTYASSANQTLSGVVSGTGALNQSAGTLTLSGANTYSGGTTLSAGQLNINNTKAIGAAASTFTISGGTIDNTSGSAIITGNYPQVWNGDFTFSGTSSLNLGTGAVTPNASRQVTVSANYLTVGGNIGGGAISLTKAGSGTLVLSGANTFSGGTTVNGGTLSVSTDGNLGAVPGASTANSIALNGGTLSLAPSVALTLNANRGITIGPGGGTIGVTTPQVVLYGGIIAGAGNTLTYTGTSGTSEFRTTSANNTFGKLVISGGIFTAGSGGNGGSDLSFGAVPSSITPDAITLQNGANMRANNSQGITLNANRGITLGSGGGVIGVLPGSFFTLTIPGPITGTGAVTFGTSDSGTNTLSGANTYSGGTTLGVGTLNINSTTALGPGTFTIAAGTIDNTSGGAITLANNNRQNWNGDFTFTGTKDLNLGTGAVVINIASRIVTVKGGNLTVGGAISGSGYSLTKAGAGTLVLSGVNTYTGGTTINAGTLALGPGGSIAASITTVASSATLGSSATTTRTIGAATTYNSGALASFTGAGGLSSTVGKISVTGSLTLNANAITVNVTGSPLGNGTYRLMDCTGSLVNTGTFGTPTIAGIALPSGATASISVTTGSAGHLDLVVSGGTAAGVTTSPSAASVCAGSTASFSVTGSGSTPLSYAWRKHGSGWRSSWNITDTLSSGYAGHLIGNPNGAGISDIGTACWQQCANGSGSPQDVAYRNFPATVSPLTTGQSFAIDLQNLGNSKNNTTGKIGFGLTDLSGSAYLEFQYIENQTDWTIHDSASASTDTGVAHDGRGLHVTVTLTSATTYSCAIQKYNSGGSGFSSTTTITGTLVPGGSGGIQRLYLGNINGGISSDIYFNNLVVGPGADDNGGNYSGTWTSGATDTFGQAPLANGATGNGSTISGAATANLQIATTATADAGNYDCVVYNANSYSTSTAAALTVNAESADPTSATAGSSTICSGGSTTLTLNGGGGGAGEMIHWYTGSCGGTSVGTGNGLSVSPTTTTTYYGRYEDGAPCSFNTACQSVTVTVNQPPTAPNKTFTRAPGISLKISIADLGAADPGNGTVTFNSVAGGSQSATISHNNNYIYYLPQAGNNNGDAFTYTTTDGQCVSASGTITVSVASQPGAASGQISVFGDHVSVTMYGIPGYQYDVQRSTDNMNSWTTLSSPPLATTSITASTADGSISFTDDFSDLNSPPNSAYYRIVAH